MRVNGRAEGRVITANETAAVELAHAIFGLLEVDSAEELMACESI